MAESSQRPDIDGPKRRSARIVQAVPLTIAGVDALGRPFQERTSTVTINCHGCRYLSKHYVLKNMWVNMEVPHNESGRPPRRVRGRVSWIQRPRTVRELFQVGVELETSGNFWGIAFPPADWFPFPENAQVPESESGDAMTEQLPQEAIGESPEQSGEVSPVEQSERSIRIIPMPQVSDSSPQIERQFARLVSEAEQQLLSAARESASRAIAEQTRPLLSDLEGQLKEAADKSVGSAISSQMARLQSDLQARLEAEHDSRIEEIRTDLSRERERQIAEARAQIEAHVGMIEQVRLNNFNQEIQNQLQDAVKKIRELSEGLGINANLAQATIEQARQDSLEGAEKEARLWDERLKRLESEVQDRISQLEGAAKRAEEQISTVTSGTESRWSNTLEADIAQAQAKFRNQTEASLGALVSSAVERLKESARETEEQVEQHIDAALAQSAEEAEARLGPLRESLGAEVERTQNALAELQQLADQLQAKRGEFSSMIDSSREDLARQSEALLENQSRELSVRADAAISSHVVRLQPALESAGRETIARLVTELEEQIAPHVARATEIVNGLSLTEAHSSRLLAQHQDMLWQTSERVLQESIARAQEALDRVERNFSEAAQTTTARLGAELETKATETTQSTFEALYKSADWYEKKLQAQMQSTLERGLSEADAGMREKAGEISGLFASELDRYSRNYVDHAQGQIEEHSQAVLDRTNLQMTQTVEAAAAGFAEKAGQYSQAELDRWQEKVNRTFEHHATKAEEHAAQIRLQLEKRTESLANEFLSNLASHAQQSLEQVNRDMTAHADRTKDQMRQEGRSVESDLQRSLESLGIHSMEEYRQRLENASNSWILTTVSKLHQQSEGLMEQAASSAESKLRAACNGVFAEIGETLRERLSGLTLPLDPPVNDVLNHRTATQSGSD